MGKWSTEDLVSLAKICVGDVEEKVVSEDPELALISIHWYKKTMLQMISDIGQLQHEIYTLKNPKK